MIPVQPLCARVGRSFGPGFRRSEASAGGTPAALQPLRLPRPPASGTRVRSRPSRAVGERGDSGSRRGSRGAQSPGVPVRRPPQSRGRALPPPLTRATGSSPLRRRPRAAKGRGQRQQIEELAWPHSGLRRKPPRPGRCSALARRPPRASRPPRPASARLPSSTARRPEPPPRARHHGAPARRLAAAAARSPSAPRGAQPSRCEGESRPTRLPWCPALRPGAPRYPFVPGSEPPARPSGAVHGKTRCTLPGLRQ